MRDPFASLLTRAQIDALRGALGGRLIALCFGSGVDSTAMMVALKVAGIRPSVITFADTGGEKPPTLAHLARMQKVLERWKWPAIEICKKVPLASTGYTDLFGNCWKNETLPSLAFGMKSCSIKWKGVVQDQHLQGVQRGPQKRDAHPVWREAQARGETIVKLIGYDCGPADMRRASKAPANDGAFDFCYPLQLIGWSRQDCVRAIAHGIGPHMIPIKSACFFCPASKAWELFWLAGAYPDMFEAALSLERRALTGKHSRFDVVEFGASWEDLVRTSDRFPSTSTCVGLGRSFAWNQWARVNGVVDEHFRVRRDRAAEFLAFADRLAGNDNAYDVRSIQLQAA